jgi:hypothetical protein
MKRNLLLKLAVIASSVLLVAGFVSYRAGAFNWLTAEQVQPAPPAADPADSQPVLSPAELTTIMSGSKSAMPGPIPGPTKQAPPTIIGGSKSMAPLIPSSPPPAAAPAQQPNQPAQK